eukprot:CAMPEP_0201476328 /NCGR_PEP_ID=MMETSP0151_2-20130828/1547_1 /ASSEMBLY_ACC=CAM_ASM_000257 /TAXON_ID=200890 /ORGANISM="Paramoeba atlantica, Strain 621/1 / CCAP 1560/9" /LENGTH=489 /DNA_ID=CAMNT_0047856659 /DNA_START=129 /DNA_END=1598 /DNA_ORIENTATION=-
MKSYTSIPIEDNLQNILDFNQGKEFNFKALGDYLYLKKGPLVRTGPSIMGMEQLWVFDDSALREVYTQEGTKPDGVGAFHLPLVKYNQEKLENKLWPWSDGENWYKYRFTAQKHLFGHSDAESYVNKINQVSKRIGDAFPRFMEESLDDSLLTQKSTFEYIYGILYGSNPGIMDMTGKEEEQKYVRKALDFFRILFFEMIQNPAEMAKFMKEGETEKYKEFSEVMDYIIEYGEKISQQILDKIDNGTADADMLNSYIAKQRRDNPDIDVSELAVNGAVFLATGVDTTSCAIGMMLTRLAEDPQLQEEMLEEMKMISGGDPSIGFQYQHKDKYHVIKSMFRELGRTTPVTGGFVRRMDYPIQVSGYEVPANTFVICFPGQQYTLQKDTLWDDSKEFNPRRWYPLSKGRRSVGKEVGKEWSDAQVSTFGRGTHMCPGARVAESEIMSFFCEIIPRYKLSATWDPANPPYQYSWARGLGTYTHIPKINVENR